METSEDKGEWNWPLYRDSGSRESGPDGTPQQSRQFATVRHTKHDKLTPLRLRLINEPLAERGITFHSPRQNTRRNIITNTNASHKIPRKQCPPESGPSPAPRIPPLNRFPSEDPPVRLPPRQRPPNPRGMYTLYSMLVLLHGPGPYIQYPCIPFVAATNSTIDWCGRSS